MSAAVRPRPGEAKKRPDCLACGHADHFWGTCGARHPDQPDNPMLRCACGSDWPTPGQVGRMVADLEFLGFAVNAEWKKARGFK